MADASLRSQNGVDELDISAGYKTTSNDPLAFLATEGNFIVTRNGVVVSPDWGAEYVPQYFVAQAGTITPTTDGATLTGSSLCDVADQLSAIWDNIDFATATPEDIAAAQQPRTSSTPSTPRSPRANTRSTRGPRSCWANRRPSLAR